LFQPLLLSEFAVSMTSSRPYLLRAIYEWIVDNGYTPHVVVDATIAGVKVPEQHVKDGQIVLNIAPGAVAQLEMGNDALACSARFGGVPMALYVPMSALLGIYARENGQGMIFEPEPDSPTPPDDGGPGDMPSDSGAPKRDKRPSLKVVK
jgi:stringent starvation protein B